MTCIFSECPFMDRSLLREHLLNTSHAGSRRSSPAPAASFNGPRFGTAVSVWMLPEDERLTGAQQVAADRPGLRRRHAGNDDVRRSSFGFLRSGAEPQPMPSFETRSLRSAPQDEANSFGTNRDNPHGEERAPWRASRTMRDARAPRRLNLRKPVRGPYSPSCSPFLSSSSTSSDENSDMN